MWIILLDHSGSMGDPFTGRYEFAGRTKTSAATIKLEAAKQALLEHLLGIGSMGKVALIEFTSTASIIFEGRSSDASAIQGALDMLSAEDGTDIAAALNKAKEYIDTLTQERVLRVLVISDGLSEREPAEASAQLLAQQGAIIDVILIDPTEKGDLVARTIAIHGNVSGVRSAQELSDTVALAKQLEHKQAEEVARVVEAYEREKAAANGNIKPEDRLSFTAGYPGRVLPSVWRPLLVYLHTAQLQDIVERMLHQHSAALGLDLSTSTKGASSSLKRETPLRLVPHLEGFTFNPSYQEVTWYEDVQEVHFRLRADDTLAGRSVIGSVDIYTGPLQVAQLPLAIDVQGDEVDQEQDELMPVTAQIFSSIFASYSHQDTSIVEACAAAYKALGVHMYIDTDSLHSGDFWRRTLQDLISRSDLFQLYWSKASSQSPNVQEEWEYALSLRDFKREHFIRPLYWEEPMPKCPDKLNYLHFAKLDLDALARYTGRPFKSPERADSQQGFAPSPVLHYELYAPVIPLLPGTSTQAIAQAHDDVATAITFLEEATGLRYYPAPTLLVDHYAVRSVRALNTVDLSSEQDTDRDRALALADVLNSISLKFHVHGFVPEGRKYDDLDERFGKGHFLAIPQFEEIRRKCEYVIRHWVKNYYIPQWQEAREQLGAQLPTLRAADRFSLFARRFLDQLVGVMRDKRRAAVSGNVTIYSVRDLQRLPRGLLENAGVTVEIPQKEAAGLHLRGPFPAFLRALQAIEEELAQALPAYDAIDRNLGRRVDENGEWCLALSNVIGSICRDLVYYHSSDYDTSLAQTRLLVDAANSFNSWVTDMIEPDWERVRRELHDLNMAEFSERLPFVGILSTFLATVQALLKEGLQQLGTFEIQNGYPVEEGSWQTVLQEVPGLQLLATPNQFYSARPEVLLRGQFSEFVRLFEKGSQRLVELIEQSSLLSSPRKRLFAVEVPTYGIYAPPTSTAADEALQQWALQHETPARLMLSQNPRVLFCLDATQRIEQHLEQEQIDEQQRHRLTMLFQRCVLIHEHFHAILEIGLDSTRSAASGVQYPEQWQSASRLNEALAVWMELHYARENPDLKELVLAYIKSGTYPEWPYRGAEYLEELYKDEGIIAIRNFILSLRQAPYIAQTRFDELKKIL